MKRQLYNMLFLCTGNSARSILAESLINHWGRGKFRGFSVGSHPKGTVHPIALELLTKMNLPTEGLRSKNWDEFAVARAPPLDFVFTVCDNAAGEICPVWPGQIIKRTTDIKFDTPVILPASLPGDSHRIRGRFVSR